MNAAMNQTGVLDRSIDDVLEHFVYVPKQSPANPQDIPFFLSTRLAASEEKEAVFLKSSNQTKGTEGEEGVEEEEELDIDIQNAFQVLTKYETRAAQIAHDYEANMVRF